MRTGSARLCSIVCTVLLCAGGGTGRVGTLVAQDPTTGTIRGTVRTEDGGGADGARVSVVNMATGFATGADVRGDRFSVQGLAIGGPYRILVRMPGFAPTKSDSLMLRLGATLDLRFVLRRATIALDTLQVTGGASVPWNRPADGGIGTTIPDSLVHRLPTMNRNFLDFARLVPQISTKIGLPIGGLSGGGALFRFNNYLVDGAPERFVTGNSSLALGDGKSVPLEAVSEYQVLIAPFDVRYGDFAGALINTVTRSGTNQLHGSAFVQEQNDGLARSGSATAYDRAQYGVSVGGPVLRDRVHFLVATELQHLVAIAPGPYVGQLAAATPPVPAGAADLARFDGIMRQFGLDAGSSGRAVNALPLANLFARLDLALPSWHSRVLLSGNYARSANDMFSRSARDTFSLTSYQLRVVSSSRLTTVQVHTSLRGGTYNTILISQRSVAADWRSDVRQPIVRVAVPSSGGSLLTLQAGTHQAADGMFERSGNFTVVDDVTHALGTAHEVTVGVQVERFWISRGGVAGSFGAWTFSSLDSLERGTAERYEVRRDFGSAGVPIGGTQYAAWLGDQWRPSERLQVTAGLRADLLVVGGQASYNAAVDSIFQRRTDAPAARPVLLGPRLGVVWDPSGDGGIVARGGVGVFTGRPPVSWMHTTRSSYGVGIGVLRCGALPTDAGPPPAFQPDPDAAPMACASGPPLASAPTGDVDLLAPGLRMAQALRASLAFDFRLPGRVVASTEVLLSRSISDFAFVNLNLVGPQATDQHGRVLYGTISTGAIATPALRSGFTEVIELVNTSDDHALQLTQRFERQFADGFGLMAAYTHARVRDAQTPLRAGTAGIVAWSGARVVSGRQDDLSPGISLYDLPHRVVLAGTWTAPWHRWTTTVSFSYVGESGSPFTYVAWGVGRRGDLNADGSNANDPVYVPRSAFDTGEIRLSGLSDSVGADNSPSAQAMRVARQQTALESFIDETPCLRRQRGRILARNSCREPWSQSTIASLRQSIPLGGHAFEAELDVFNVLGLLDPAWGRYRAAAPRLLEHVGQTPGTPDAAQPVFRFDGSAPRWTILPAESASQLQLALHYRF